uniref:Pyrin domain-containing protein n=1 Tax=Podarcis muralis TaxID=64176 RepID=A0A670JMM7_PODMU
MLTSCPLPPASITQSCWFCSRLRLFPFLPNFDISSALPFCCRRSTVAKTTHSRLLGTLENLANYNLRKFKYYLNSLPIKEGYSNIPRGRLEKADPMDLTQLLLGYYNEHYAVEVVLTVLKSINQRDLERNLLNSVLQYTNIL